MPECRVEGGREGGETAVEVCETGHVGEFAEAADAVFLVVHGAEKLFEGNLVVAGFHAFFEGAEDCGGCHALKKENEQACSHC